MTAIRTPELGKKRGHQVRRETLGLLTGAAVTELVRALGRGQDAADLRCGLSPDACAWVADDLKRDPGWAREHWCLDDRGEVRPVAAAEFDAAPLEERFSRNDCLRKPAAGAWALRGFLSAVTSSMVREHLSAAFGERLRFRSADIARYGAGDYLRRHADLFEDRRLGMVWFLGAGFATDCGGELVVEGASGTALVVRPVQGTLAAMAFRPGCWHQVAMVRTAAWQRYSIATHFHRLPPTAT